MDNEEFIEKMKEYARLSLEAQYWFELAPYAKEVLGNDYLAEQFAQRYLDRTIAALEVFDDLRKVAPTEEIVEALEILDSEMAEIARQQALQAIESGAAAGLRSAEGAVFTAAADRSNPVHRIQQQIEDAFIEERERRKEHREHRERNDKPRGPKPRASLDEESPSPTAAIFVSADGQVDPSELSSLDALAPVHSENTRTREI